MSGPAKGIEYSYPGFPLPGLYTLGMVLPGAAVDAGHLLHLWSG